MESTAIRTMERRQDLSERVELDDWGLKDAHPELARILEGRRWDVQPGPFRGFGSPPGRF